MRGLVLSDLQGQHLNILQHSIQKITREQMTPKLLDKEACARGTGSYDYCDYGIDVSESSCLTLEVKQKTLEMEAKATNSLLLLVIKEKLKLQQQIEAWQVIFF